MGYAVVRSGGLQYRVSEGDTIRVPRMKSAVGDRVEIDQVLVLSDGGTTTVGTPLVEGAKVSAEIVGHGRHKKVRIFKKKRRKGYELRRGHRQDYTEIRITGIKG